MYGWRDATEASTSCYGDLSKLKTGVWIVEDAKWLTCELEGEELWLGIEVGLGLGLSIVFEGVGLDFTRRISLLPPLAIPLAELVPTL